MIEWYKKVVFENYANFKGRARRKEYWMFTLTQVLILLSFFAVGALLGSFFDSVVGGLGVGYMLYSLYSLATLIPTLGVVVRRLHDVGKSGWFYFIFLVPIIGVFWLLILLCTEGDAGPNEYGEDPKNVFEEINEIGNVELQ